MKINKFLPVTAAHFIYIRGHTTLRNPTANESNDKLQGPRQNLRMAMRRNEVVDFPFSPASGILNVVVIKKVQSDSRIIRWQWQRQWRQYIYIYIIAKF